MSTPKEDMASAKSYLDMAKSRFMSQVDKSAGKNDFQYEIAMGLNSVCIALNLSTDAIFTRIERLHTKLDRIEAKLNAPR